MAAAAAVAVKVAVKVVRSGLEGGMGRWVLDGGGVWGGLRDGMVVFGVLVTLVVENMVAIAGKWDWMQRCGSLFSLLS